MASNIANSELTSTVAAATKATRAGVIFTYSSLTVTDELQENTSFSSGSAALLPLPNDIQMASTIPNEPQVGSTPSELSNSLHNVRPPDFSGTCNVNHGFENDSTKNSKETDPPSYEEAMKAMEYYKQNPSGRVIPVDGDQFQYQFPDNGQFGVQDQYFYPQSYHSSNNSDVDIEMRKAICARMVFCLVFVGFAVLAIRIIFFIQ